MAFEKPILEWDAQGVEPPSQVRTQGWKPLESPAPDYFNYMWHTTGEALKELQEKALDKTEVGGDLVATLASLQSQITANTNNFNDFLSVKTLGNGNDPNTTILSLIRTAHANAPAPVNGNANWTIFTLFNTNRNTTSNRTQLAMGDTDGTMLFRAYKSGAWSSWKQVSDITDTQNRINIHAQNNKIHTHYATASGTNALTLTASTFVGTLAEGDSFRFKNPNNSTSNMTLNVNSSGAKSVRDSNGNNFNRGKSGVIYTVAYDGVNFQLQGEGGGNLYKKITNGFDSIGSGVLSKTITVPSLNVNNTFVEIRKSSLNNGSQTSNISDLKVTIVNNTTITFERNSATSGIEFQYVIHEFDNFNTLDKGVASLTPSNTVTVNTPSGINANNCIILYNYQSTSSSYVDLKTTTNSTSFTFSSLNASSNIAIQYCVVSIL